MMDNICRWILEVGDKIIFTKFSAVEISHNGEGFVCSNGERYNSKN